MLYVDQLNLDIQYNIDTMNVKQLFPSITLTNKKTKPKIQIRLTLNSYISIKNGIHKVSYATEPIVYDKLTKDLFLNMVSDQPNSQFNKLKIDIGATTKKDIRNHIYTLFNNKNESIIMKFEIALSVIDKIKYVFDKKQFKSQEEKDSYIFCIRDLIFLSKDKNGYYDPSTIGYNAIRLYLESLKVKETN